MQIYLTDNVNIPMDYTDKLSFSELEYLLDVSSEYVKEKNEAQLKT